MALPKEFSRRNSVPFEVVVEDPPIPAFRFYDTGNPEAEKVYAEKFAERYFAGDNRMGEYGIHPDDVTDEIREQWKLTAERYERMRPMNHGTTEVIYEAPFVAATIYPPHPNNVVYLTPRLPATGDE